LREFDEIGIEDSGGVLGDVHDVSAGAGYTIGSCSHRCCYVTDPEQK
jgi:hypothetical protein